MKLGNMYNKNSRTAKQSCSNISELELKLLFDRSGEEGGELVFRTAVFKQNPIDRGGDRQINALLFTVQTFLSEYYYIQGNLAPCAHMISRNFAASSFDIAKYIP